ncbi:sensor histidine kinase [Thalassotalea euphylliae]|uniref:sensor histidine kinase n=1 Tax=Thalassotalea euphylliae TaxID=1655234 RepID=UPI00362E589B
MFINIRSRIVAYFITMIMLVCTLFTALVFIFSYNVEDNYFIQLLKDEMSLVKAQVERGEHPSSRFDYISFYQSSQALPDAIRTVLVEEPERIEFSGPQGEHYHLLKTDIGFLVAEVSDQLVVRKIKGGMLQAQLAFIAITGLLIGIGTWFLAKRLVRPIDRLMQVLDQVQDNALPANFSAQFKPDEIGMFARRLDDAMQRVQQFVVREQDFTRDVSHELRTPVAVVKGATTLLASAELTSEQRVLVSRIKEANTYMEKCIEGLLTLAREKSFEMHSFKLLPVVEKAIVEHHQLLEGKTIEVDVKVSNSVCVIGNEQAMNMIVSNIVANAFTHSHSGAVEISFSAGQLIIKDNGQGISPAIQQHMFEAGVKSQSSEGFGIGLSLVKRLTECLQLSLNVTSNEHGTTVCLSDFEVHC